MFGVILTAKICTTLYTTAGGYIPPNGENTMNARVAISSDSLHTDWQISSEVGRTDGTYSLGRLQEVSTVHNQIPAAPKNPDT